MGDDDGKVICRIKQETTTPMCDLVGNGNQQSWKCEKCQAERDKIYEGMERMTCNGSCSGSEGRFDVRVDSNNCDSWDADVWSMLAAIFKTDNGERTPLNKIGCTMDPIDSNNVPQAPICQSIDSTLCSQKALNGFGSASPIQWAKGGDADSGGTSLVECTFDVNDVIATPGFADTWAAQCLVGNKEGLPEPTTTPAADLDNAQKEKLYRAYCGGAAADPATDCYCFNKIVSVKNVSVDTSNDSGDNDTSGDSRAVRLSVSNDDKSGTGDSINVQNNVENIRWEIADCDGSNTQQCANLTSKTRSSVCDKFLPTYSEVGDTGDSVKEGPLYFPTVTTVRDEIITAYCNDYPDAPDCACAARMNNPMYQAMTNGFAQLGVNYNAQCWWEPCQNATNRLIPSLKKMGATKKNADGKLEVKCADQLCVNQVNITNARDVNINPGANVKLQNDCQNGVVKINSKTKNDDSSGSSDAGSGSAGSGSGSGSADSGSADSGSGASSPISIGMILGIAGGILFLGAIVTILIQMRKSKTAA